MTHGVALLPNNDWLRILGDTGPAGGWPDKTSAEEVVEAIVGAVDWAQDHGRDKGKGNAADVNSGMEVGSPSPRYSASSSDTIQTAVMTPPMAPGGSGAHSVPHTRYRDEFRTVAYGDAMTGEGHEGLVRMPFKCRTSSSVLHA